MNNWLEVPRESMTYDWLVDLLDVLESSSGVTESPWIEVKSRRDGPNVAEAVGSLANADGGIVLVGVLDASDAKGARAADRIVGVPAREYENLTMSLRSSLEDGVPEIVPIAIPNESGSIVLVLRVDAEAFAHPVVVSGKVKIRVGSSSINADRLTVERLVDRDRQPSPVAYQGHVIPINAESMPFWDHTYQPYATFRVVGSLRLPHEVLQHAWFPSPTVRAAVQSLGGAVLPDRQWLMGALAHRASQSPRPWTLEFRRAQDFRMNIQPHAGSKWPLGAAGAGAYVAMNGQILTSVLAVWLAPQEDAGPLALNDIHDVLLSLLVTCRDLLLALAETMTPTAPTRWGGWTGWIQPRDNSELIDTVVDLSRWERAAPTGGSAQLLPETSLLDVDGASFCALVHEWLLLLLATNGVLGHEDDIEALHTPDWLS